MVPRPLSFEAEFLELRKQLSRLLKRRFASATLGSSAPIEETLGDIVTYYLEGNHILALWELARMRMLVKNLREIEARNPKLLKAYSRRLRTGRLEHYIGTRFEINIAATLVRSNVSFHTPDPPDFAIPARSPRTFLECTAVHLTSDKPGDLKYKIGAAIRGKASKEYCCPSTALLIDFTNVHKRMGDNELIDARGRYYNEMRRYVETEAGATKFGGVVLFSYIVNQDLDRFESVYSRTDNEWAAPPLKELLDDLLPFGGHAVTQQYIPRWG